MGVVIFDRAPETVAELMRQADAAMYVAKRSGKDKVHVVHGPARLERELRPDA